MFQSRQDFLAMYSAFIVVAANVAAPFSTLLARLARWVCVIITPTSIYISSLFQLFIDNLFLFVSVLKPHHTPCWWSVCLTVTQTPLCVHQENLHMKILLNCSYFSGIMHQWCKKWHNLVNNLNFQNIPNSKGASKWPWKFCKIFHYWAKSGLLVD